MLLTVKKKFNTFKFLRNNNYFRPLMTILLHFLSKNSIEVRIE